MEDTWTNRDLPVLDAVVTLLDQLGAFMAQVRDIVPQTGMRQDDVVRALSALNGSYLQFEQMAGPPGSWRVRHVSPDARRAVGQWPTAESLVARIVEGITEAAEHESDPQRKRRLRETASVLGGTAKDVVTEIVAKIFVHAVGMG